MVYNIVLGCEVSEILDEEKLVVKF